MNMKTSAHVPTGVNKLGGREGVGDTKWGELFAIPKNSGSNHASRPPLLSRIASLAVRVLRTDLVESHLKNKGFTIGANSTLHSTNGKLLDRQISSKDIYVLLKHGFTEQEIRSNVGSGKDGSGPTFGHSTVHVIVNKLYGNKLTTEEARAMVFGFHKEFATPRTPPHALVARDCVPDVSSVDISTSNPPRS